MFKVSMKITPLAETNRDEISPELLKKKKKRSASGKKDFRISGQKVSCNLEGEMNLA